jgi:general secretion pathway protein A
LLDFGVVSSDEVTSGRLAKRGRHELTLALQEFLRSLALLQAFALVIVDEAQNVSIELLEHLRILSDLGGSGRLLQVVLVGQEDLRDRLLRPEMRAFNQRIAVRASLGPLAADEIAPYIAHRLSVAGGEVVFARDAIRRLTAASHGVPRVLNLLCDRALTIAAAEGSDRVDGKIVAQAAEAIGDPDVGSRVTSRRGARWRRPLVVAPAVIVLLAAIAAGLLLWQPGPVQARLTRSAGLPALPAPPPLVIGEPLRPIPPPDY